MFSAAKTSGPSGYNLTNSLRFRGSASAYLNRTFATPTSSTIWTWSAWVKRGGLTGTYRLFGASTTTYLTFNSSDQLNLTLNGTSAATTTAVYRDPAAWYHIVYTQNGSAQTIYVNGTSAATGTTAASIFNTAIAHQIGSANTSNYLDGYLTEVNFVDGQALTPSSFGNTNATTGVWQPARYTGSYGTNGFYLKFSDIATTSGSNAGLGKDFSGNTNYWTTNNISVTAGTTYDAMTDVPTNTSATVANYAVLNPIDVGSGAGTLNANLTYNNASGNYRSIRGTIGMSSGKWYWEISGINDTIGLMNSSSSLNSGIGVDANAYGYIVNGNKINNSSQTSYGASYTSTDIMGVAFDADAGTLTFYKNNTSQGTAFSGLANGPYFPAICGTAGNFNFGQRPFTYTPPTGFVALNTYNLPTPTILQGNKYMDATTYTGTGSALTVTNAGSFKPDFVWIKSRSNAYSHGLFDSVRGALKVLQSSSTAAEATESAGTSLTGFNSNGFALGTNGSTVSTNVNGATFVGWQWQAGQGSTSSNTSGSITSTVSVNATAGFSVVTFTGNGTAGATVGHGLGVTPSMIIFKNRSLGGAGQNWLVWHKSISQAIQTSSVITLNGFTGAVYLNFTNASSTYGFDSQINGSTNSMLAYAWSEIANFSKFGSYTGNGSADGPFVFTNFRPKFVLIKNASAVADWYILDSSRNTYNVTNLFLYPDLSNAEVTGSAGVYELDFLSNGFKIRGNAANLNGSGNTIIYMAFAESPFRNSLAR